MLDFKTVEWETEDGQENKCENKAIHDNIKQTQSNARATYSPTEEKKRRKQTNEK